MCTGRDVADVFLTSYKPFFSRVIVTARDTSTPHAKALAEKGAELVQVSAAEPVEGFLKAFEGVDAAVNLLGQAPPEYGDAVGEAAIKSAAAVYFPSEYGSYVIRSRPIPGRMRRLTSMAATTAPITFLDGKARSGSSRASTYASTASSGLARRGSSPSTRGSSSRS